MPRSGGKRPKLTPEIQEALCASIRAGNYYVAACARAGVDYSTFLRWLRKGRKAASGPYCQFCRAVERAKGEAEEEVVRMWVGQIPDNWQACRDFLARRFPKRWGPKETHEVTGKGGEPLRVIEEVVFVRAPGPDQTAPGPGGVPGQPGPAAGPGGRGG